MADVQIDNGNYLRVHNKIYDALARTRVPGEARQVFDYIIRKTYGFNKTKDWISLSQFIEGTGITSKSSVIRAVQKLEKMKMIYKEVNDNGVTYWINKDYDEWVPFTKKSTFTNKSTSVYQKVNLPFTKKRPTKDNTTKDNIQKTSAESSATPPSSATKFLKDFGDLFKERFGKTYLASFKKDTVLIKDMLGAIEYDDLVGRAKLFFRDTDEFIQKLGGYTIGAFKIRVNKYIVKKPTETKPFVLENMTAEEQERADKAKVEMLDEMKKKGLLRK